jgi:hypothetical protein
VTRTIIIDAVGLEENMIAEPAWPELPGARIYPDQPQGISRDDGEWVLGHKEFRYAVVPEQEGELVLPELTVEWWDTVNDRQQTAVLPAHTVYVQPSALVPPAPEAAVPAPAAAPFAESAASTRSGPSPWWRGAALLFAGLWLATLFLLWRSGGQARDGRGRAREPDEDAATEAELRKRLLRACERGDAAAARRSLLSWLRRFAPGAGVSLLDFATRCGDARLKEAIYALDAEGFSPGAGQGGDPRSDAGWDGGRFRDRFESWRRSWLAEQGKQQPALTDLYAPANRTP